MEASEIIRRLKLKEEKALTYLFDNYAAALNGIILRILKSEKLAEEVLQQTFLKIWDKIDLYDESKSRLFTWMSSIAKNTALDVKRLKKYENDQNTYSLDVNLEVEQKIQLSSASIDAQYLIGQLGEKYGAVIECIYLNGYTQSETASELNIPLGTVKTRARSAILDLRDMLKDEKMLFTAAVSSLVILIVLLCL